jgi:DNA-binding MarR family transcriptional regulator
MPRQIERDLQLTRPVGSLAREAVLNLYRTEQFVTTRLEAALRPADLRLDEFNVLRIIRGGGAEGHPRPEIERRMLHSPDRLLAMLHKLKTRGLVEGTLRVSLTAEGAALLAKVDPGFEKALEEQLSWIPDERLRVAIEVLESIRNGPPAGRQPPELP